MRWWLNTDHKRFSVDNAVVSGLDFASFDPSIWMVQWIDGKGEIERQDSSGNNLNGLRETFIDIIPYCPLFQQFLTLLPGLTLPQAKKLQCDLIAEVFNAKRQEPFHYPVASGDYSWDATDETLFSSLVPALQNSIAKVNEVIARLNSQFPALDNADAALASQVNGSDASIVSQVNSSVVAAGNSTSDAVNSNIVAPGSLLISQVEGNIVNQGNGLRDEINANITNYVNSNYGSITVQCASSQLFIQPDTPVDIAAPGIVGSLLTVPAVVTGFLGITADFEPIGSYFNNISPPSVAIPSTPWTPMSDVTTTNTSWIPVGMSTSVEVTPAEAAAIMTGIAARTNDLQSKKVSKQAEVNALTTIPAVIAYDVTVGW